MSERLKNFLVDLATDPRRRARFSTNPTRELVAAGLSESERRAVLSGDSRQVRDAIGSGPADHLTQFTDSKAQGAKKKAKKAKKAKAAKKAKPAKKR